MMKIFLLSTLAADAKIALNEVSRKLTGEWINDFYNYPASKVERLKREIAEGEKGFRPLAAMMLYMQGEFRRKKNPQNSLEFDEKLAEIEEKYTSYGCYCWIDGVDAGVIGGGRPIDVVDHHCKELYRCYKCVNNDYNANYTDISYSVDFTVKTVGDKTRRSLECDSNVKQDASNICECDKRFAENIAREAQSCKKGAPDNEKFGSRCIDETFRTINGGGSFFPNTMCNKEKKDVHRDQCCGIYPDRNPYSIKEKDCCERKTILDPETELKEYFVVAKGNCDADNGERVVISEAGNPHIYVDVTED